MTFVPNTQLYGCKVKLFDQDGKPIGEGTLDNIPDMFGFNIDVDGEIEYWQIGQTTDAYIDGNELLLFGAWKEK